MLKLYWCTTEDSEEDWFVVARNSRSAARWFEEHEGYEKREVHARPVKHVPVDAYHALVRRRGAPVDPPFCPDLALLRDAGADVLRVQAPRVVQIGSEVFVEGILDLEYQRKLDDALEADGRGRPNGTVREVPS
jgi:hypothetical protein